MASALHSLIGDSTHQVFRRAYLKRRDPNTALYEDDWVDFTRFVKSWGTIQCAVDDIRLNRFTHSGITFRVRNDTGAFNPETDANSLWFGSLTRYRTLVKIEAGYYDENGTALPTDSSQGIFVMSDEVPRSGRTNELSIQCRSLVIVFDEVIADEISGLGSAQSASDLIAKIRDHTDGAGNFVFRQFITSTSWSIQTTTVSYNLATTTSELENISAWDLMAQLAECEGFVLLINRTGGLEFRDRSERTTTVAFDFYGQGFRHPNVISFDESKDAFNKFYNRFRLKWTDEDTSTSYVESTTETQVHPSNTSWKFGARTYEFENKFFATTATAQTVVDNLRTTFSEVAEEVRVTAKFTPHVEVSDKVTLSYHSYDLAGQENSLWDIMDWASDTAVAPDDGGNWALEAGENFDYNNDEFKVLARNTNLDNMTTQFILRRV